MPLLSVIGIVLGKLVETQIIWILFQTVLSLRILNFLLRYLHTNRLNLYIVNQSLLRMYLCSVKHALAPGLSKSAGRRSSTGSFLVWPADFKNCRSLSYLISESDKMCSPVILNKSFRHQNRTKVMIVVHFYKEYGFNLQNEYKSLHV